MSDAATEQEQAPPPKPAAKPRANPMEQMVLMVAFLGGMIILIDPAARALTGSAVGFVLGPAIGWQSSLGGPLFPVLTIVFASAVMVLLTSGIRHYFTDYLKQARAQEVMRAFSKEMRSARKENNLHKMKKLTEKNKELMSLQAEQSTSQLKPMAITMVVVVPIFAWLLVFLDPSSHGAQA
ncbi:MAG TPA: EMC3/TMCO1 family protein, partial [Candidatus Thermoplasmatota archaeon]|nr:EMC3/TMCO1 family protein [Candidatus Thermoplasmatota archaeon]